MTENILSSTNQSPPTTEEKSSSENSPPQRVAGISLLDIPHFTPSQSRPKLVDSSPTTSSSLAPVYLDEKQVYEYEFTCIYTDTRPMFCGLWDTDDLTACQRISASNIGREEITYNTETGMGFFHTTDGLRWCFKKEPYMASIGPMNPIGVHSSELEEIKTKNRKIVQQSPDDILNEL